MALSDSELAARRGISVRQVHEIRRLRGTSNDAIEHAPDSAIRKAIRKLAFPDSARKRLEFERLILRDNQRRVEPGAHARAVRQCAAMRGPTRTRALVAGVPSDGPVDPLTLVANPKPTARTAGGPAGAAVPALAGLARARWQWLGPGNVGGRTRAIVVHPTQSQRMLAASAGGGIWFTENGGARWDPVDDFMANLAVCCLALDPSTRTVVYAGTGEGFGNGDALRGGGIFRLVGTRWRLLPATQGFGAVNRIGVSRSGKIVLAATPGGLMRSTDSARATWTKVIDAEMADVKCHPSLSTRAVAAALDGGAWFSTDSGATWQPATAGAAWHGRVELTYARANPNTVYASVDSAGGGELWRSTDGGKTYQRRVALAPDGRAAPFLGGQGWYSNVVWAGDPSNANLVLVGGINLWRSADGGQTMAEISTWYASESAHADHHAIVAHPQYDGVNNRTVFFGNDWRRLQGCRHRHARQRARAPVHRRMAGAQQQLRRLAVLRWRRQPGNRLRGGRGAGQRLARAAARRRQRTLEQLVRRRRWLVRRAPDQRPGVLWRVHPPEHPP
jgi:photosystem II stability/assembly factor-like uncharacterized protein